MEANKKNMLDEMTRLLQGATNKGIKTILENPDVKKFLIISELSLVQGVPKNMGIQGRIRNRLCMN